MSVLQFFRLFSQFLNNVCAFFFKFWSFVKVNLQVDVKYRNILTVWTTVGLYFSEI